MDARHREVLIAVIREYVDSAEPVGSRVLTKRYFPSLSPATIRNAMSDLEDMGYLAQPHTSAGRIPTDKAYRFYVESFPPAGAAAVRSDTLPPRRPGIDGFMERASAHLSSATRMTGLLLAPPLKHTRIARVDLIPLEGDRALAAVVTDAGVPLRAVWVASTGVVAAILLAIFAPANAFLALYGTAVAGMLFIWIVILVTYLRFRAALAPDQLARLPIRMPAHRTLTWFAIVSLAAISATTSLVDGLQYSVVSFLPFLALISVAYARMRGGAAAADA